MAMALPAQKWTLAEMHSLPDDGNKYELVSGVLLVTPAPSPGHERIANAVADCLKPYVDRERLGEIFRPRAVFRLEGSETEPDVMVRPRAPRDADWEEMPRPILLVEVISPTSRRHDLSTKRSWYVDAGVPTYWVFDGERRVVHVIQAGAAEAIVSDRLTWHPEGADEPLVVDVPSLFRDALE